MTMINDKYGIRAEKLPEVEVDARANCLVAMFSAPGSKPLYCDAVRYLTRAFLNEKADWAMKHGRNPAKCFGAIIYNQLRAAGIYPKKSPA